MKLFFDCNFMEVAAVTGSVYLGKQLVTDDNLSTLSEVLTHRIGNCG
jgi:hypothetical protein